MIFPEPTPYPAPPPGTRITMEIIEGMKKSGVEDLGAFLYWRMQPTGPERYSNAPESQKQEAADKRQRFLDTLHPNALHALADLDLPTFKAAFVACDKEQHFRVLNNMVYFIDVFNDRHRFRDPNDKPVERLDNLYLLLAGLELRRGASISRESVPVPNEDYSLFPREELLKRRAVLNFVLSTRYPDPFLSNPIWISEEHEQFITDNYASIERIISLTNSHDLKIEHENDFSTLVALMGDKEVPAVFTEGQL